MSWVRALQLHKHTRCTYDGADKTLSTHHRSLSGFKLAAQLGFATFSRPTTNCHGKQTRSSVRTDRVTDAVRVRGVLHKTFNWNNALRVARVSSPVVYVLRVRTGRGRATLEVCTALPADSVRCQLNTNSLFVGCSQPGATSLPPASAAGCRCTY